MKILMISIPNHHFFQWVNQLQRAGFDVYWFDITDGGPEVERIKWVTQIKGWKLRWDFPFRDRIKRAFPSVYRILQQYNERSIQSVFEQKVQEIQPDIVHCFEMKLGGLPILDSMLKFKELPFVYSSWGSDIFYYKEIGIPTAKFKEFLARINYIITDCKRDFEIVKNNGFANESLGVFIGNGGLDIDTAQIKTVYDRNIILVKGYDDGIGKACEIIKALALVSLTILENYKIIVYSCDQIVADVIETSTLCTKQEVTIYKRGQFIANSDLLNFMGKSAIHIANSLSDGLPTSSVEAMGMGAFPIQSNPGRVSEEVITHGVNGFLIEDPFDTTEIARLITEGLTNLVLREAAQRYNVNYIDAHFNRTKLQLEIVGLYRGIKSK